MELLVNDTVLFTGSEKECVQELNNLVKSMNSSDYTMIKDSLKEVLFVHRLWGEIYWHIEYTRYGGTFKEESE